MVYTVILMIARRDYKIKIFRVIGAYQFERLVFSVTIMYSIFSIFHEKKRNFVCKQKITINGEKYF